MTNHEHCWGGMKPGCNPEVEHLVCCECGQPHPSIPASIRSARIKVAEALQRARDPEPLECPVSGELMYAPLDKISIVLYNKSIGYLDDDSEEEQTLIELSNYI